jgi:hypothetical protein
LAIKAIFSDGLKICDAHKKNLLEQEEKLYEELRKNSSPVSEEQMKEIKSLMEGVVVTDEDIL